MFEDVFNPTRLNRIFAPLQLTDLLAVSVNGRNKQATFQDLASLIGGAGSPFVISALTAISVPLVASDLLAVSVGGNKKATAQQVADFVGLNMPKLIMGTNDPETVFFGDVDIGILIPRQENFNSVYIQSYCAGESAIAVLELDLYNHDDGYTGFNPAGIVVFNYSTGTGDPFQISGVCGIESQCHGNSGNAAAFEANINSNGYDLGVGVVAVTQYCFNPKTRVAFAGKVISDNLASATGAYFETVTNNTQMTPPTFESSVLLLDNRDSGLPLLKARVDGVTALEVTATGLLNLVQTPAAGTITPDHTLTLQLSGVSYKVPCVAV